MMELVCSESLSEVACKPTGAGKLAAVDRAGAVVLQPIPGVDGFGSEYETEILQVLFKNERQRAPDASYLTRQTDLNAGMRAILMDWLVEVCEEYKLQSETLFLAVQLTDRFLSLVTTPVLRGQLQLVGVTAMLLAAKYEEIHPPTVEDFVYITDFTYTREQVLATETHILDTLSFELVLSTPLSFLARLCHAVRLGHVEVCLAKYYAEWTIQDYAMLRYLPSQIAACAVALTLATIGCPPWPHELSLASGYALGELRECMRALCNIIGNIGSAAQHAVWEKYSHSKWHRVSKGAVWLLPNSTPFDGLA